LGPVSENTLEVYTDGNLIFSSTGKWLHPLFELEDFLASGAYEHARLLVKDKIVGKAGALLLVRLGVLRVKAGILSELGRSVFDRHAVRYEYGKLVPRILCQTEHLLERIDDLENAYALIAARAGRIQAPSAPQASPY